MPAIPAIITAGAGLAGSVFSANKQANANKQAVAAQTDANNKALAFEGTRYADTQNRMQPFTTAGQTSVSKMASLLGLPDTYTPPAGAPVHTPPAVTQMPATPVRMKAPNGQIQDVPPDRVDHYLQRGAVRVT